MGVRDGQFFIIGTIVIAGLIMGIVSISTGVSTSFTTDSITKAIFDDSVNEFPRAVSRIAHTADTSEGVERDIRRYIDFQKYIALQHGVTLKTNFLIGLPIPNGYNVTFGNFMDGTMQDVSITLDNTTRDLGDVPAGNITTLSFAPDSEVFQVRLAYRNDTSTFYTSTKITSYISLRARSGSTVWRETRVN
ncbi:MAG: hypothetical protein SV186_05945 [Candidatus Nanohaloarchaea archaeon]|nr:hypothetical protein [Candidatus Nanohaloarchaea archaeon]